MNLWQFSTSSIAKTVHEHISEHCLCGNSVVVGNNTQFVVYNSVIIIAFQFVLHVLVLFLNIIFPEMFQMWYLIIPRNRIETCSKNWNLIIKTELWTMNCLFFCLFVWIHNRMYKPKFIIFCWHISLNVNTFLNNMSCFSGCRRQTRVLFWW
jgi:RsiW-degrading membrane proteinase PrsW (M82 family)